MADLLERLHAENPVPQCDPPPIEPVWQKLGPVGVPPRDTPRTRSIPHTRRRRFSRLGLAAGATLAGALVLILALGSHDVPPSLAVQLLRATDSRNAVVHYVSDGSQLSKSAVASGSTDTRFRWEVWVSGSRAHVLFFRGERAGPLRLAGEIALTASRIAMYDVRSNRITVGALPAKASGCTPSLTLCGFHVVDPLGMLRYFVRSGAITNAGHVERDGRRLAIIRTNDARRLLLPGSRAAVSLRALVDATTYLPVQITVHYSVGHVSSVTTISTITRYERLPNDQMNRQLLKMSSHSGVRVQCGVFESDGSVGYPCSH